MRAITSTRRVQQGITLIELMIVLAVAAILAVMAAPSFRDQVVSQRVKGAAEGLVAALQNTKAEAIKTNSVTRIVFTPAATNNVHADWCYGMTPPGAATCVCTVDADPTNDCAVGTVVQSADFTDVSVTFNTANTRSFNPLRGTGTAGTVIFSSDNNKSLGVTISGIGRIRICRPAGTTLVGYSDSGACP